MVALRPLVRRSMTIAVARARCFARETGRRREDGTAWCKADGGVPTTSVGPSACPTRCHGYDIVDLSFTDTGTVYFYDMTSGLFSVSRRGFQHRAGGDMRAGVVPMNQVL